MIKNKKQDIQEDISEIIGVAEMITLQINNLAFEMTEKINDLESSIKFMRKEVDLLAHKG